jgi:hypothetical protein
MRGDPAAKRLGATSQLFGRNSQDFAIGPVVGLSTLRRIRCARLRRWRGVAKRANCGAGRCGCSNAKRMIDRGDRQHDVAVWFGVNPGRINDIATGVAATPSAVMNSRRRMRHPPGTMPVAGQHSTSPLPKARDRPQSVPRDPYLKRKLAHSPRHEAYHTGMTVQPSRPYHRRSCSIWLGYNGIVWYIDPFTTDLDAIVAVV